MKNRSLIFLLLCFTLYFPVRPAAGQWTIVAPALVPGSVAGIITYRDGYLWAGRTQLERSTDSGASWTNLPNPAVLIYDLQFLDRQNGVMATGTSVRVTHDGGMTWSTVRATGATSACMGRSPQVIAVADRDIGIVISRDGGLNWTSVGSSGFAFYVTTVGNGTLKYFAGTSSGGYIGTSVDDGANWTQSPQNIDYDSYTFAIDSCSPDHIYLANEDAVAPTDQFSQIFVTTNGGASWAERARESITYFSGSIATGTISAYAQSVRNGILRSTDRGLSWQPMRGSPSNVIDSRLIAVINDNIVISADENGNIWRTLNSGGDPISMSASQPVVAIPPAVAFPDSLLPCVNASLGIRLMGTCTTAPAIRSVTIGGRDAVNFTSSVAQTPDSISVTFAPTGLGNYTADATIRMTDGTTLTVPLSANGKDAPKLTLSSNSLECDTIGATVRIPIKLVPPNALGSIDLTAHYDTTMLVYLRTVADDGISDLTASNRPGVAQVHLEKVVQHVPDSIVGYVEFRVFPTKSRCTTVLFDSISNALNGVSCASTNPEFSADVCSVIGCGVPTISEFLRYARLPELRLVPNPALNTVAIQSDQPIGSVHVRVFDALGTLVRELDGKLSDERALPIEMTDLASGVYSVRVESVGATTVLHLLHLR